MHAKPSQKPAERRLGVEGESQDRGIAVAISHGHGLLAGKAGQQSSEGGQKKCIPARRERNASLESSSRRSPVIL